VGQVKSVQRTLDEDSVAMRHRRETVEHPFGTIKAPTGATRFLVKTLPRVEHRRHQSAIAGRLALRCHRA